MQCQAYATQRTYVARIAGSYSQTVRSIRHVISGMILISLISISFLAYLSLRRETRLGNLCVGGLAPYAMLQLTPRVPQFLHAAESSIRF